MHRFTVGLLLAVLSSSPAWGAKIAQFSPQGTVSKVESIRLQFDKPAIAFGDGQAPAPVDVICDDADLQGDGRWLDDKRWTYSFTRAPGPGTHCEVKVKPSFTTLANESITGKTSFAFKTGGPIVTDSRPYGTTINEDQVFVLRFNGIVDAASLLKNTHCVVEGLGEAVPVRAIDGDARRDILAAAFYTAAKDLDTAAIQLLQCKRRLPAEASVQLNVGAGVATPSRSGRPTVATIKPQTFDYKVRESFKATFSCQRENSSQPCTPVSPLVLSFSGPISRDDASKLRLKTPTEERAPSLDARDGESGDLTRVQFDGPFPELSDLTLILPEGLKDDAGRDLVNADQFPLQFKTAAFPPLVKFAAAPFGVIERFANAAPDTGADDAFAAVPLTLRNVEAGLSSKELALSAGKLADYTTQNDTEVLRWYARIQRLDGSRWTSNQLAQIMADKRPESEDKPLIDTRGFSVFKGNSDVKAMVLPGIDGANPRPFEVIGVPVKEPGLHVLEVESARLGTSLLESGQPMYVRTMALVTNLAVHVKTGRDDMLAWVTTLDDGKVVPGAAITVLDCSGATLAQGKTDADGIWHHMHALDAPSYCQDTGLSGTYVSARIDADHPQAHGQADFSFVFSDWNRGIESWRFNVPTDSSPVPTVVAHTVMDRSLFQTGETVSMKHFLRVQTRDGLALPGNAQEMPDKLIIEHQGSGQRHEQAVSWNKTPSGGLSAAGNFSIPKTAALGMYSVMLTDKDNAWYGSSQFRVEEFKLPVLTGSLKLGSKGQELLVKPDALDLDVQIAYVSGGPAGKLPVTISGITRERQVTFPAYEDYSFQAPDIDSTQPGSDQSADAQDRGTLFVDKQALTLDAHGGARLSLSTLPEFTRPMELLLEASFSDPNGQVQTLAQSAAVWPSAVQAGIRTGSWTAAGKSTLISGLALTPKGQAQANVPMTIRAVAQTTYSVRKRMVGGFYSYENRTQSRDLGMMCEGRTNAAGVLECLVTLSHPGSVQLLASVQDEQGRSSTAQSTVWVTGAGDLWFGGENDDRIDIIPLKKQWAPGETAQFQVRMPYRQATALVAVEREGVLKTQVLELQGTDPTIQLPIEAQWGPNVYVSVLVLRGRLHQVPWQSFFTWGWQRPLSWYEAFNAAKKEYVAPTAFIDLSKPSFRFGLAEIQVTDQSDELAVTVKADKAVYQVRETARVTIEAKTQDGKPAAHGSVALAVVDQALLELAPNDSWNLLAAMRQRRSYGVETATAQMEIVGRRHYGRKAMPAGGGGGESATRKLLDTLLVWIPSVELDEHGRATVAVPLNDAITRFKVVAIADFGASQFGTGTIDIASTQDLQVIPGLPAVVREGDQYLASLTVRNATQHAMQLELNASYTGDTIAPANLKTQEVTVAAGTAHTVNWNIKAPENSSLYDKTSLNWTFRATSPDASDSLAFTQTLMSATPIKTRQATLMSLVSDKPPVNLPVSVPKGALAGADGVARGGLQVHVQSSLAGGLTGVRDWFAAYPYTCLEQLSSKAIGLRSTAEWQLIVSSLPDYLDDDGLVAYFPGAAYGNEVLTAYLLAASHEAQQLGLAFAIPESIRQRMTTGLLAFAEGTIVRNRWSPQRDLDVRKLSALEALSRYGLVKPRMLGSIDIAPNRWPTSAVIDWLSILQRVPAIPDQKDSLEHARQILKARMVESGGQLVFGDDAQNDTWWLMTSRASNMAKLAMATMDQEQWRADSPRMIMGLLGMQQNGAWRTTTANLLGSLAVEKFARHYENTPVSGRVSMNLLAGEANHAQTFEWAEAKAVDGVRAHDFLQAWPDTSSGNLLLEQQGQGTAWATIRSLAAVPVVQPVMAGYGVQRSVTPVSQAVPGVWSRGDVYRVTLQVQTSAPTTWTVLTDPIPAGATILGSGLGRDSVIATRSEQSGDSYTPTFIERGLDSFRAYYEYLPKGVQIIEYTVRLNTVGQFSLPATRIEAMYQPDFYGELPNSDGIAIVAPAGTD